MGIVAWVVLGALAGWIASMIMGKNGEQGAIGNIVVGIIGALIGGFVFDLLGGDGVNGFNLYSLFVAVVGACILLWIVRLIKK